MWCPPCSTDGHKVRWTYKIPTVEVGSIGKVGLGTVIFLPLNLALYLFVFAMDGSVCLRNFFFKKKKKSRGSMYEIKKIFKNL
jgi:hypothetical protein